MRLFTAIALPQETKDKFLEIARGKLPIPYVNADHLHITLNFLGESDTDETAKIKKSWKENLDGSKKFKIEFEKLIKFRQQIHMTVKENPDLNKLQAKLAKHFTSIGIRPAHPKYYAHMTIGNLHMDKVMNRERKIEEFPNEELDKISFEADAVTLFESKYLLHHPHYIPLDTHILE